MMPTPRLRILAVASLGLALVLPSYRAAAYEETAVTNGGTVAGRVWFPNEFPESESFKVPKDNHVCGIRKPDQEFIVDEASHGLQNVIIEILGITAGKPLALPDPTLDQQECTYLPHVQVAAAGSKVVIANADAVLHNIHAWAGDTTLFNIAQPPIGNVKFKKQLTETGPVRVVCDVHEWMAAYIYVVDHPYVAITDAEGRYTIPDVPPGSYKVKVWHEGLGEVIKDVTVTAGGSATVDLDIGK